MSKEEKRFNDRKKPFFGKKGSFRTFLQKTFNFIFRRNPSKYQDPFLFRKVRKPFLFLKKERVSGLFAFFILLTTTLYGNVGERYCRTGEWGKAAEHYSKAMEKKNRSWTVPFNLGVSQYHLKEWDAATSAFKEALERCREVEKQESVFYNLGNALYRKGEVLPENEAAEIEQKIAVWEEGLGAYASALGLKKKEDTQHNHDWVKVQIERLKKKQQEQKNNSQKDNKEDNKENDKREDNKEQNPQNKDQDKENKPDNSQNQQPEENQNPLEEKKEQPQTPQQHEMQNILNAAQKEEQKLPLLLLDSTNEDTKKDW